MVSCIFAFFEKVWKIIDSGIHFGIILEPFGINFLYFSGIDFGMLFWIPVLGGLQDHILVILDLFWGPFWRPFWSLLGYRFCIDFRRVSRHPPKVKINLGWGRFMGYLGSSNKYYSSKSASLQKLVSLSDQLTCKQQICRATEQLTCR